MRFLECQPHAFWYPDLWSIFDQNFASCKEVVNNWHFWPLWESSIVYSRYTSAMFRPSFWTLRTREAKKGGLVEGRISELFNSSSILFSMESFSKYEYPYGLWLTWSWVVKEFFHQWLYVEVCFWLGLGTGEVLSLVMHQLLISLWSWSSEQMCHYHFIPLFTLLFCIPYSLKKPHLIYIMLPKDLGHINYFLGMEAHASVMTLLYCSPYILDLLKRALMDGANPN